MGSAAASVESARLEPELREALAQRAEHDHETTSSVIRKALREYLKVPSTKPYSRISPPKQQTRPRPRRSRDLTSAS
jgi:hypothetical protein